MTNLQINKRLTKYVKNGNIMYNLIINHYGFFGLKRITNKSKKWEIEAILFISVEIAKNLLTSYENNYENYSISKTIKELKIKNKRNNKCLM